MTETRASEDLHARTLAVDHWGLLTVFVLLRRVFAMRQTGALPGQTIRVLDMLLVAASLALTMRAAGVGRRTQILNGGIAGAAIMIAALVGALVGLLVAQTGATETHRRLDELTGAIERLDSERQIPDSEADRDSRG